MRENVFDKSLGMCDESFSVIQRKALDIIYSTGL